MLHGMMQEHGINYILADEQDHTKLGLIERMNRSLKNLLSKYQTMYNTKKWIDALDDLLENYNNTIHSSTGYAQQNLH